MAGVTGASDTTRRPAGRQSKRGAFTIGPHGIKVDANGLVPQGEAARLLGVPLDALATLVKAGHIPSTFSTGHTRRLTVDTVLDLLERAKAGLAQESRNLADPHPPDGLGSSNPLGDRL